MSTTHNVRRREPGCGSGTYYLECSGPHYFDRDGKFTGQVIGPCYDTMSTAAAFALARLEREARDDHRH